MPRRRDILVGGLALALARGRKGRAAPAPAPDAGPSPAGAPGPAAGSAAAVDVDIHCHTFCAADLPIVGFVAHYVPGLTDLSRELTRWPEVVVRAIVRAVAALPNAAAPPGATELSALQAALKSPAPIAPVAPLPPGLAEELVARLVRLFPFTVGPDARRALTRYLETIYLVSHPRAALAATLADAYPSVSLFTPCLVDYDAWSEDRAPTPLATQIQIQSLITRLSIQGKVARAGARFHPFVAFDPRRDAEGSREVPAAAAEGPPPRAIGPDSGALEMVRYAVESAGFAGVKIYPPVGFAPLDNLRWRPRQPLAARLDAALRALYAYCQAEEVPVTAHASAENEYGLGLHLLVAPEKWAPVLAAYPELRVNFGHFGHDYGAAGPQGAGAPGAWIRQAATLMQAYPNVYADLSNSPLVYDAAYAARFAGYLREMTAAFPKVKKRLMYGSDFWLDRLEPGAADAVAATRRALTSCFTPDEVADVMGRNALRFLGLLDDDHRPRAGRAARRLRKLYAGAAQPPWLP